MYVTAFDDPSHMCALERDWVGLWRQTGAPPAKHPDWIRAWWNAMGSTPATPIGGRRHVTGVEVRNAGGRLEGMAVFVRRLVLTDPGPRVRLDLMGSGEKRVDEICSDYGGLLAAPGRAHSVASAVADKLLAASSRWDDIVLPAVAEGDEASVALGDALLERGCSVSVRRHGASPYVALPKTFDDYLGQLDSDRRYYARKALRDFEKWAGEPPRLVRAECDASLTEGLSILEKLHRERWGGDGVFRSERFASFHREVSRRWLRGGDVRLDLSWLVAHGRPIAVLYSFVADNKLSFYQAGRALDVPKQVRPGIVSHLAAIKRAIDEGLTEYDFLEGEAQYKQKLMTSARHLVSIHAVRGDVRGTVLDALAGGARAVARAVLRLRGGSA